MTSNALTVAGVDIGGTNIGVGLLGDDHTVLDRGKAPTPTTGPDDVLDVVAELVRNLDGRVDAVGVGLPGVVRDDEVITVPNLAQWHSRVDVAAALAARLDVPVALGNDADVGLLGEWLAGSAQGAANVLGVWMGTGIGGGLILDRQPFHGGRGAAGELGHVVVQPGGALCGCGRRGCLEGYAGRRSMERVATGMRDAGRQTALFSIRDDEDKTALTSKVWARALEEGDELAVELMDTAVAMLGVALGSVVNLLDLDLVVVGGGMAEKLGQPLADRLAEAAAPWLLSPSPQLRFVVAALGDDSGLVGAAALGRARLLGG